MTLALDPSLRRVWRSPDTLQFGVDRPRLVLSPVSASEERMIAALDGGVGRAGLVMLAARAGAGPREVDALLERLAPVLARETAPAPARRVVLDGQGVTAGRMLALLRGEGVRVDAGLAWSDPAVEAADAAVIVASYAIEPERHARWLRRDIPHLPVVFGDGGVTVGPLVEPGRGPCLRCVALTRTDDDPAWPAMAAQLYTSEPPGETEVASCAVASVAVAALLGRVRGGSGGDWRGRSARFDPATGLWTAAQHAAHPDCGCSGVPKAAAVSRGSGSRRGTATADAGQGGQAGCRAAPSSATGGAGHG